MEALRQNPFPERFLEEIWRDQLAHWRDGFSAGRSRLQEGYSRWRRHTFRNTGIQTLDSRGLKNAIDWARRPRGQNSFSHKPSGVIGTSPGAIGIALAQSQLRGVLCYCNSPAMNTVEAQSISNLALSVITGIKGNDANLRSDQAGPGMPPI
jgi:hypothetical protein